MFYQDLLNCIFGWWRSRRWWRMSLLAFLPMTLFLATFSLVVYGSLISSQTLGGRYFALVEEEVDASFNELLKPVSSTNPAPEQTQPEQTSEKAPDVEVETDSATQSAARPVSDGQTTPTGEAQDSEVLSRAEERRVQVPLRRILQLGNYNPRVAYVVASQLARQGRVAMAARMMRDIAPLEKPTVGKLGFAYAHAWLAEYAMMSWKGSDAQAETLLGDLEAAERGGATLTASQVRNFASLLVNFKRTQESLGLLSEYAPKYPELNVMLAILYDREGRHGVQYTDALEAGRESFQAKQQVGKMTTQDWFYWVQLELLDKKIDQALRIAQAGFQSEQKNPDLRRLYSNVLLAKHQALAASLEVKAAKGSPLASAAGAGSANEKDAVENAEDNGADNPETPTTSATVLPDLRYLEAACKVDSANPAIVPEVAKAIAMGRNLNPQLKEALERSLAEGTASGITHLILANYKLTGDSPEDSLPHLRLALSQMPNSSVVLNNLAYALMKYDPDKLSEAQQLMERALSIPGSSISDRASMLDTLGEIRLAQGETLVAIELLEQAIALDGSKLGTRRRLVESYRKVGMSELAEAQQRRISELSSEK